MAENSRQSTTILEAQFEPRLRTYTMLFGSLLLLATVVGIILIPFWLIFGKRYVNRYYDNLFCELTYRALHFKKGVWFHTEKTIPLDKIQDLTFKEGPLLRRFGLSYLQVETASQSVQGASDMSLTGIVDAREFRKRVLDQRDLITEKYTDSSATRTQDFTTSNEEVAALLKEISSTLKNIEKQGYRS